MRQSGLVMYVVALTACTVWLRAAPTIGDQHRPPRSISSQMDMRQEIVALPPVAESPNSTNDDSVGEIVDAPTTLLDGPIDVDTLIGYALANNREIQAARFHARSLGAHVPQAKSLPDPVLMTTVFLEEIQTAAGPQQVAMSLSQKFPWCGKLALRSQVAYYDSMALYSRVAATELNVVEQVKRAYFDLYFAQQAATETRRLEQPLEEVISVAKTRYETGSGKVGLESVFQAQVELAQLKTDLVKLNQTKRQAQARLAGVLHLPPQTQIEALASIDRDHVKNEVATLVGLAESCQPVYEAWRREVARDRAAVNLARREYWPDITASFNWYDMGAQGLSPVANGRDAFSLGVGVNLPVYRKRLDAAVREAEYQRCATALRFEATRDQFQIEIDTLHAQFREHDHTLRILETDIVPRAEETLTLALESYRAARTEFQQLIDVYRTLLRHRVDAHRHLAASQQALASLERAVGCAVAAPTPSPE